MSEEQNRWTRLFRAADENGDGGLDPREFRHLMQHLGSRLSREEMHQCFTLADKNNSGRVRLSEFVAWAMEVKDDEGSIKDGGGDRHYRDGFPPMEGHPLYSFKETDFEPRRSVHRSVQKFKVLSQDELDMVEAHAARLHHQNPWMPAKYAEAIFVWTMDSPIYKKITTMSRIYDGESEDWFERHEDYCYYLERALDRIPNHRGVVYKHVPVRVSRGDYPPRKTVCWPGPSSSSVVPQTDFLKKDGNTRSGTLFWLNCRFGKDISRFSRYGDEKEILFSFNSYWSVDCHITEHLRHHERIFEQLKPHFRGLRWQEVDVVVMTQLSDDEYFDSF